MKKEMKEMFKLLKDKVFPIDEKGEIFVETNFQLFDKEGRLVVTSLIEKFLKFDLSKHDDKESFANYAVVDFSTGKYGLMFFAKMIPHKNGVKLDFSQVPY